MVMGAAAVSLLALQSPTADATLWNQGGLLWRSFMRRTVLIAALIAVAGPANAQFLNPSPAPGPTLRTPAPGPTLINPTTPPTIAQPAMPAPPAPPPAPPISSVP